jgi:hypothetical protein
MMRISSRSAMKQKGRMLDKGVLIALALLAFYFISVLYLYLAVADWIWAAAYAVFLFVGLEMCFNNVLQRTMSTAQTKIRSQLLY